MYIVMIPEIENPQEAKSIRVSLRGMLRLIRFDTLRRVHIAGFLARRLIYSFIEWQPIVDETNPNPNSNPEKYL